MPKTYEPIATYTIPSAASTYTFSSIPSTYTDLILRVDILGFSATDEIGLRLNSDTGNNYSRTIVYGNGTSALSSRNISSAVTDMRIGSYQSAQQTIEANFMNYANTTTYKTVLSRGGGVAGQVGAGAHLWLNTSAISSITVRTSGGANFTTGSTFTLYGIKAA